MYQPKCIITPNITKSIKQITNLLIDLKHLEIPSSYKKEYVAKVNSKMVHSSTAIEGNTLTLKQVEKVIREGFMLSQKR